MEDFKASQLQQAREALSEKSRQVSNLQDKLRSSLEMVQPHLRCGFCPAWEFTGNGFLAWRSMRSFNMLEEMGVSSILGRGSQPWVVIHDVLQSLPLADLAVAG